MVSGLDLVSKKNRTTNGMHARGGGRVGNAKHMSVGVIYWWLDNVGYSSLTVVLGSRTFALTVYVQFMSQRHATSWTSARSKKAILALRTDKGLVAVALTWPRFNSLGRLLTPIFF